MHHSKLMQKEYNKHGCKSFVYGIIHQCDATEFLYHHYSNVERWLILTQSPSYNTQKHKIPFSQNNEKYLIKYLLQLELIKPNENIFPTVYYHPFIK